MLLRALISSLLICLAQVASGQEVVIGRADLVPSGLPGLAIARPLDRPATPRPAALAGVAEGIPGARLLNSLVARGKAQGLDGILYENRDRGHSTLSAEAFPGLTFLSFDKALKGEGFDYGLAGKVVVEGPLIGNSSTALTRGPFARSLTRLAMTSRLGAEIAQRQYAADSLYIYPEHRDHDGRDLYPAIWPYTINSQGSSGSDQPIIRALLMTLAGFTAETRARLVETHQLAPALQMILRRNLLGVDSDADYMTALAHPSAIDGTTLRSERMIAQAAAMRPDQLPPPLRLEVEEEAFRTAAGLTGKSEILFTTPQAIARLWRAGDWAREMMISAQSDPVAEGQSLRFHWVLLRGDPEKVWITRLDEAGSSARLRIAWHDEFALPGRETRLTSRVDIGVFAETGAAVSAPAYVSVAFPTHQKREYLPGPDGAMRLVSVNYDAAGRSTEFDPRLFWTGAWRDEMRYDAEGQLAGWQRHDEGPGGAGQGGQRVTDFAADGRLRDGRIVRYAPVNPALPMVLDWRAE